MPIGAQPGLIRRRTRGGPCAALRLTRSQASTSANSRSSVEMSVVCRGCMARSKAIRSASRASAACGSSTCNAATRPSASNSICGSTRACRPGDERSAPAARCAAARPRRLAPDASTVASPASRRRSTCPGRPETAGPGTTRRSTAPAPLASRNDRRTSQRATGTNTENATTAICRRRATAARRRRTPSSATSTQ